MTDRVGPRESGPARWAREEGCFVQSVMPASPAGATTSLRREVSELIGLGRSFRREQSRRKAPGERKQARPLTRETSAGAAGRRSRSSGIASVEERLHPVRAEEGNLRGADWGSNDHVVVLAGCFGCRSRRAALGHRLESDGLASAFRGVTRGARKEANERRAPGRQKPRCLVDGRRSDPEKSLSLTRRRRTRIWLPAKPGLPGGTGATRASEAMSRARIAVDKTAFVRRRSEELSIAAPPGTDDAPKALRKDRRGVVTKPKLEARRQARLYPGAQEASAQARPGIEQTEGCSCRRSVAEVGETHLSHVPLGAPRGKPGRCGIGRSDHPSP